MSDNFCKNCNGIIFTAQIVGFRHIGKKLCWCSKAEREGSKGTAQFEELQRPRAENAELQKELKTVQHLLRLRNIEKGNLEKLLHEARYFLDANDPDFSPKDQVDLAARIDATLYPDEGEPLGTSEGEK